MFSQLFKQTSLEQKLLNNLKWKEKEMKAFVTTVIDGDTIDVLCQGNPIRVRIASFDAPEMGTLAGLLAKKRLEAQFLGRWVKLIPKARDIYGRLVAAVYLSAGPLTMLMDSKKSQM